MSRRERQRRREHHRGSPLKQALVLGTVLTICAVALGALGAVGWVVSVADSAPNINQLRAQEPGALSQVFAADGSFLGYIQSDTLRTPVTSSEIPNTLRQATIAIEDRRFYQHGGVDYQGILRAGVKDIFSGAKTIQGGSTLTMQLVDNIYLIKAHHNLKYKIVQAKLAEELERKESRAKILTQYLNDVDYGTLGGQTAYGVGAASQLFFDKPPSKLDLAQAALLAGLPQAPSEYNPVTHQGLATARRHSVLQAMVSSGYISQAQADTADAAPLEVHLNNHYSVHSEPYVFDYVRQALNREYCPKQPTSNRCPKVDQGGLRVYTTIDPAKQAQAFQAIAAHEGQPGDPAAAVVTVDPGTGHILAMATSSAYGMTNGKTTFDYATQALRQTGSAFKVFVLMTLIHDFDGDPDQTYYNSHELSPGWLPAYPTYHVQTAEKGYQGNINVTKATALSDNTVFAQLDADVTPEKVRSTAYAMGITSHLYALPSEGLGAVGVSPLEMADAYATLANGGYHIPPTAITKVAFPNGTVNKEVGNPPRTQVFTSGEAYAATKVLKGVITSGTGTAAQYGCPAAGKTGTTSNYTDAWFVGYTPQLSTAVWVGYPNDTSSMNDVNGLGPGYGGTLSAPIWHDYMAQASGGYCGDFSSPTDPFHGSAFSGNHTTAASAGSSQGGQGAYGPGSGSSSTTSSTPYTYTQPNPGSQQPPSHSGGAGIGPGPAGATPGTPPGNRGSTPTPTPTPTPAPGSRSGGAPPGATQGGTHH
ncbi:MAG: penicillin-binding protein [Actinomycetota bacterium]|nr:penicillin-binding protein [Actinomycetota bacterium]